MGRQINFCMTNETSHEFILFLKENGFSFINKFAYDADCGYYLPDDMIEQVFLMSLYKPEYGKIVPRYLDTSNIYFVAVDDNPVIELSRPCIDESKRRVHGGRLWVTSEPFNDDNANRELLIKDYNMLVRWIKKRVPYVKDSYSYIEDEIMKKWWEEGYD